MFSFETCLALKTSAWRGKEGLNYIISSITRIDAASAQATMPDDETKVKGMITDSIGFDAVNTQVTQNITTWVGQQLREHIDSMLKNFQQPAPEAGSM